MQPAIRYEPAIDGLRAIAVLVVIVFHLDPHWLPGGFTGVDIFFVISGFLITRILLGQFDAGTFSIWRFYHRRIARLVPSLTCVGFATLLSARFIYDEQFIGSTAADFLYAMCSLTNIRSAGQGNYFESSPLTKPFLHYWSLSLEEQFYVFYPIVIGLAYRTSRRAVIVVLTLLLTASLAAGIAMTRQAPTAAFYLLPFRAWELLAGGVLAAWVWRQPKPTSKAVAHRCQWLGLAGLVAGVAVIREDMGFPGWVALIPVGATVVLIAGLTTSGICGVVYRWLTAKPLVSIGQLSYALYLTHWPVCSLVDFALFLQEPWLRLAVKIVLIGAFTAALHWVVEQPARVRLLSQEGWKREAISLGLSITLVVPTCLLVRQRFYSPRRLPVPFLERGGLVFNPRGKQGTIVLAGDSHATQYAARLSTLCEELDLRLTVVGNPGEQFLPSTEQPRPPLLVAAGEVVNETKPLAVVLSPNWVSWVDKDTEPKARRALDELRDQGVPLVVLTAQPKLPADATREAICHGARPPFFESESDATARETVDHWLLGIDEPGIEVIAVGPHLVSPDGELRIFDDQRRYTFSDRTHVNEFGAALVIPDIKAALLRAMAGRRSEVRRTTAAR